MNYWYASLHQGQSWLLDDGMVVPTSNEELFNIHPYVLDRDKQIMLLTLRIEIDRMRLRTSAVCRDPYCFCPGLRHD